MYWIYYNEVFKSNNWGVLNIVSRQFQHSKYGNSGSNLSIVLNLSPCAFCAVPLMNAMKSCKQQEGRC